MDHDEALRTHAAERYLLGELTDEEREAYEEHFFACRACADQVKSDDRFVALVREVLEDKKTHPGKAAEFQAISSGRLWSWWRPGPQAFAFAGLMLAAVFSIYQNLVTIPRLRQAAVAQPVVNVSLLSAGARGPSTAVTLPRGRPVSLSIAVPPGFSSYRCEISGTSQTIPCGMISAEQARDVVQIVVPAAVLEEGPHALILSGLQTGEPVSQGREIARYEFVLQFRD